MADTPEKVSPRERPRPRPGDAELFRASLWLGAIGFGGGYSVLAAIRAAAVERRRWLTPREFVNTVTVAQMLPGGAAANALAYIGLRFRGVRGAFWAYTGFVLPGLVAALALAVLYVRFGAAPGAEVVLGGFNAAVVGIVSALTIKMVRTGIQRPWQMWVAGGALLVSLAGGAGSGEVAMLGVGAGLVIDLGLKRARLARLRAHRRSPRVALPDEGTPLPRPDRERHPPLPAVVIGLSAAGLHLGGLDTELLQLGVTFARTGLGAYGGGFAIIPHLKGAMAAHGWLTDRQFSDAVAIGKLTPGPVLLMATFIGYVVRGLPGAVVATAGILTGPFVLLVTLGTLLDRLRSRRPVRAALRGLTPAVAGLMAAAALTLGGSLDGGAELGIAAAVGLALNRFDVNPVPLLALGGLLRVALKAAGI
jgi:chromate transporter